MPDKTFELGAERFFGPFLYLAIGADRIELALRLAHEEIAELVLERAYRIGRERVEKTVRRGEEDGGFHLERKRLAAILLQYFRHAAAGIDLLLRLSIEIGRKLHERFEFAELRELV